MLEWADQLTVKALCTKKEKSGLNILLSVIFGKLLYFMLVKVAFETNF
jgi:hypothetical protein